MPRLSRPLTSLFALLVAAPVAGARELSDGAWVAVKGAFDARGRIVVEEVEPAEPGEHSVKGPLAAWDADAATFSFGPGLDFALGPRSELTDESDRALARAAIRRGEIVKASLVPGEPSGWEVERVRRRTGGSGDVTIEGILTDLDRRARRGAHARLLGVPLIFGRETRWLGGVERPGGLVERTPDAEELASASGETDEADMEASTGRFAQGRWVEAEGEVGADGVLRATEVASQEGERDFAVEGAIEELDAAGGSATVGSVRFALASDVRLSGRDGESLTLSDLEPGVRIKAYLERDGEGLTASRLRLRDPRDDDVELSGRVDWLGPATAGSQRFRVLGLDVIADEHTDWVGFVGPRLLRDDEDARPSELISLGRFGFFTGEMRLDWKAEDNYDLLDSRPDDAEDLRLRADLEWIFPTTRHFSGQAELRLQAEWELLDEDGSTTDDTRVRLGETYGLWSGVLGPRGSVMVGRSRFDDRRDWWYQRNLDSLRLFFDWDRLTLEMSVMEQLVDPSRDLEDVRWLHARLDTRIGKRQRVGLLWLDKRADDGSFDASWLGLSAAGRVPEGWFRWTLDAALLDGSVLDEEEDDVDDLDAWAWDAALHFELPGGWKPTFTVSRAVGSGDSDPFDDVSKTFRQTGIHDNSAKWAGVATFAMYGEVLDPELSNIEIDSVGFGIEPLRDLSIELVWHRYELRDLVAELDTIDAGDGRRLNLVDHDLGEEWDLIIAWERYEHFEMELDIGRFDPGPAFLGNPDPAYGVFLKAKWIF